MTTQEPDRWYAGVTRYQWLVLVLASLGWVFDTFEGQVFVASMREAIPSLVPAGTSSGRIALYNNIGLAAFSLGGALGGIVFGMVSDRIGRKKTMSLTILFYSIFTCLSAFSMEWWHLAGLRFLVALGVGGEWAVASTLVAEVFPRRARAHVGSLFHGSSVFGSYLAVLAGLLFIGNPWIQEYAMDKGLPSLPWRLAFAVGVFPALLIIWIRRSLREPETWQQAQERAQSDTARSLGSFADLFRGPLLRRTAVGVALATVGIATFWGAHIYGKDVLLDAVRARSPLEPNSIELKRWEMLGMLLVTTGGGLGLFSFGPISARLGRRPTFLLFFVGGAISALLVFKVLDGVGVLLVALPIFGFLTLGFHAGYAIYFPELYPTRLRSTGAGCCFNAGRIVAAPMLLLSGLMQSNLGFTPQGAASTLSLLFLLGGVVLLFAPETRGQELPE